MKNLNIFQQKIFNTDKVLVLRLELREKLCKRCKEKLCAKACPYGLEASVALRCKHCNPEEAACMLACKKGAIYKVSETVLAIDYELCDGCASCAKACPYNAIVMRNGKAHKCDLCAIYSFKTACLEECSLGAIKINKQSEITAKVAKLLGWAAFLPEGIKTKKRGVTKLKNNYWYLLNVPLISIEEASFVKEVVEEFQKEGISIEEAFETVIERRELEISEKQKEYLLKMVKKKTSDFGPLEELFEDPEIEEISLCGPGVMNPLRVYHKKYGWCNCNICFENNEAVRAFVNRLLKNTEKRLTLNEPCINAQLANGARISASMPPVAKNGTTFTIRKFLKKFFSPAELVQVGTFSKELIAFLACAMKTDCSIVIAGNTGSGKTSTLQALLSFLPENERIILVEETPELQVKHMHAIRLLVDEERNITMEKLIEHAMRMRPDRVIVSEIRSKEETKAFINTILSGQGRGSYTTFHANSANDAIKRLEFLEIKKSDIASIDLIVVQRRWPHVSGERIIEKRHVTEVVELTEDSGTKMLFEFDYKKCKLKKKETSERIAEKIEISFGEDFNKVIKDAQKKIFRCI